MLLSLRLHDLGHDEKALLNHSMTLAASELHPPLLDSQDVYEHISENGNKVELACNSFKVGYHEAKLPYAEELELLSKYTSKSSVKSLSEEDLELGQSESHGLIHMVKYSGATKLFDEPIDVSRMISISFKGCHDKWQKMFGRLSTSEGIEHTEISLSGTQFVRMLSTDESLVPVTITRDKFMHHDNPLRLHDIKIDIISDRKGAIESNMGELKGAFEKLQVILSKAVTSKKGIAELDSAFSEFFESFVRLSEKTKKGNKADLQDMKSIFMNDLVKSIEFESKRLPEELQARFKSELMLLKR
ncbi:hypothetical protein VCHA53O466_50252 [Vibrio chagasii]|nr:hypothetical protein VCHA53O466_50252 [Vibrio chagasii]